VKPWEPLGLDAEERAKLKGRVEVSGDMIGFGDDSDEDEKQAEKSSRGGMPGGFGSRASAGGSSVGGYY